MIRRWSLILVLFSLASEWCASDAKKMKVGDDPRYKPDEWDEELDAEWEKMSKKSKSEEPQGVDLDAMLKQFQDKKDGEDVRALSFLMFGSMGAAFLYLVVSGEAASYGRYSRPGASPIPHVGARLAWFIQEVPALAIPLAFGMGNRALIWTRTPNLLVWVLFIAHYANRIKSGRSTRADVVAMAFIFCSANGYMQGKSLCILVDHGPGWQADPRFLLGLCMMVAGWVINFQADGVLRSLRRGPKTDDDAHRYKVPRGGLFELVSCANYTGEILEWLGFSVASWSLASAAFAFATAANLIPRAVSHHRWYQARPSDAAFNVQGHQMAFLRLDPRLVKTKEDADKLGSKLQDLQRTGGVAEQWYTIDAETLLVQAGSGQKLREAKDFALQQPEVYEFEFSSNKFRREEDTMTYDELRESLGLKVPSKDRAADKAKAEKASKKEAAKKMKKAAKKAAKKLEL